MKLQELNGRVRSLLLGNSEGPLKLSTNITQNIKMFFYFTK